MLVTIVLQLLGAVAMLAGGTWALGPWFLLAGGAVLLVVPELLERSQPAVEDRDGPRAVLAELGMPERVSRRERRRRAA